MKAKPFKKVRRSKAITRTYRETGPAAKRTRKAAEKKRADQMKEYNSLKSQATRHAAAKKTKKNAAKQRKRNKA